MGSRSSVHYVTDARVFLPRRKYPMPLHQHPWQPCLIMPSYKALYSWVDGASSRGRAILSEYYKQLDCDFYVFSGHKNVWPQAIASCTEKSHALEFLPTLPNGREMVASCFVPSDRVQCFYPTLESRDTKIEGAIGLAGCRVNFLNIQDRNLRYWACGTITRRARLFRPTLRKAGILYLLYQKKHHVSIH